MFFAQFWISELLVFVLFILLSSCECMFLLEVMDGGRQRRPSRESARLRGGIFIFLFWKKKKQNETQRSGTEGAGCVLVALYQISMYLMSAFRSPEVGSVIQRTETSQASAKIHLSSQKHRVAFIYLTGWNEKPWSASRQLSLNPPSAAVFHLDQLWCHLVLLYIWGQPNWC